MDDLLGVMSPLQASVCVCLSVSVQAYQEMYRAVQVAAEATGSTLYKLLLIHREIQYWTDKPCPGLGCVKADRSALGPDTYSVCIQVHYPV